MTMTTMTTEVSATEPQIKYILGLAESRNWRGGIADENLQLWQVILADFIELHGRGDDSAFISKNYAKVLIDTLKTCPYATTKMSAAGAVTVESDFSQLIKLLAKLPKSKYAIKRDNSEIIDFYTVVEWQGKRYLNQLFGAPGAFKRSKLPISVALKVAQKIAGNPLAAAGLFCDTHTVCAVCSAPLTDMTSLANGIGPICIKRFQ